MTKEELIIKVRELAKLYRIKDNAENKIAELETEITVELTALNLSEQVQQDLPRVPPAVAAAQRKGMPRFRQNTLDILELIKEEDEVTALQVVARAKKKYGHRFNEGEIRSSLYRLRKHGALAFDGALYYRPKAKP